MLWFLVSNWLFSMFFLSLSHKIQSLVFQQGFLCFAVFPISPSPNLRACRSEFGGREPLYSPHYFPIFNPHLTSTLLHLFRGEYIIRNTNNNYYFSLQYKTLLVPITFQSLTHPPLLLCYISPLGEEYKIQNAKTFFCINSLGYFSFSPHYRGGKKDLSLPASIG